MLGSVGQIPPGTRPGCLQHYSHTLQSTLEDTEGGGGHSVRKHDGAVSGGGGGDSPGDWI